MRADDDGRYVTVDPSHSGAGRLLPDMAPWRGSPIVRDRAGGGETLRSTTDGRVLVRGSARGKLYVSAWNPRTGATERLWSSRSADHVRLEAVLDANARRLMLWSENRNDPPNLFLVDRAAGTRIRLTVVEDPGAAIRRHTAPRPDL